MFGSLKIAINRGTQFNLIISESWLSSSFKKGKLGESESSIMASDVLNYFGLKFVHFFRNMHEKGLWFLNIKSDRVFKCEGTLKTV